MGAGVPASRRVSRQHTNSPSTGWTRRTVLAQKRLPTRAFRPARSCMAGVRLTSGSVSCSHTRLVSSATVAQHNSPENAWVVVKGKVYDVSGWGSSHPGGNVVYSHAGKVWRRWNVWGCTAAHPARVRTPRTSSPPFTRLPPGSGCSRCRWVSSAKHRRLFSRTFARCEARCWRAGCLRAASPTMS